MSLEPHETFWNSKMKILDLNRSQSSTPQIFEAFAIFADRNVAQLVIAASFPVVPRFNCSDQMTYQTTAQIFMGLAQATTATTVIPCSSLFFESPLRCADGHFNLWLNSCGNPRLNQVDLQKNRFIHRSVGCQSICGCLKVDYPHSILLTIICPIEHIWTYMNILYLGFSLGFSLIFN